MTYDKQALEELLTSVEAGVLLAKGRWGCLGGDNGYRAWLAFAGDLNAAKALHEAVLTWASQYSIETDPTCIRATVAWWPNELSDPDTSYQGEGWSEDNPARAWLIAILKALIAEAAE